MIYPNRLALCEGEKYIITLHPTIALEYILTFLRMGYSIHVYESPTTKNVVIKVKKTEKQTVNISNHIKRILESFMT